MGRAKNKPDMGAVLGQFADARAVIETVCRALDSDKHGEELNNPTTDGADDVGRRYNTLSRAIARLHEPEAMALGAAIRDARKAKGLTQTEAAARCGRSQVSEGSQCLRDTDSVVVRKVQEKHCASIAQGSGIDSSAA